MTPLPPQTVGELPETRDRAAAFAERALPAALTVLFFTTAFAKVVASIALSLSILLFLLHRYLTRKPLAAGRISTYYALLAVYCGVMLLSLVNTTDLRHGLDLFRTISWKFMILVVLVETVHTRAQAVKYLYAFTAGCAVLAVISLYEGLVRHIYAPPSMWIAVHGGNLLMFGLIAMLALIVHTERRKVQVLLAILIILSSAALYLNGTRGAWVATGAVFLVTPWMVPRRSWKLILLSYGVMAVLAIALFRTPYVQERYRSAVDNIVQYQQNQPSTSVGWRIDMWKASMVMFREHPVLGVGLGDWQHDLGLLVDAGKASPTIRHYGQTHNMFLDAMSTQGIVGLFALLAVMIYPARIVWEGSSEDHAFSRTLFLLGAIACIISGMTDTLVHIRGVFLSYLMLAGLSVGPLARRGTPLTSIGKS